MKAIARFGVFGALLLAVGVILASENERRLDQKDLAAGIGAAQNYVRSVLSNDSELMLAFVDPVILEVNSIRCPYDRERAEALALERIPNINASAETKFWGEVPDGFHLVLELREANPPQRFEFYMLKRDDEWYVGYAHPGTLGSWFLKRLIER